MDIYEISHFAFERPVREGLLHSPGHLFETGV